MSFTKDSMGTRMTTVSFSLSAPNVAERASEDEGCGVAAANESVGGGKGGS